MLPFRLARLLLALVFAVSSLPLSVMLPPDAITKPYPVEAADPDGTLDPTFGVGGKTTTDVSGNGSYDIANALAVQPDGKIVAAGWAVGSSGAYDFALVRYTASGALDPTFGVGGKVTTDFSDNDQARALALQPDGKIVAAGSASGDFGLVRYTASGALDPTFGVGGKTTTDFNGISDSASALALQPDGKIVAAGSARNSNGNYDFGLVRYTASGALDPTFGSGGMITTDFLGRYDYASALALQPDGKIVVAGYTLDSIEGRTDFAVVRYTASGALDPTFGVGGKVTTDFFITTGFFASGSASALALQPDGKIVAAGGAYNNSSGGYNFALVRYTASGALDPTFGVGGKTTTDFNDNTDYAYALALQPDGKIVAAGHAYNSSTGFYDFAVVRYTASGALDPTFGVGGKTTTDVSGSHDYANALALQPDGKIVAAGYATSPSGYDDFAVARYLSGPAPVSSNANLSSLTLSTGTLAPAFATATTSYAASVPNTTTSITVTPTVEQAAATVQVRVNGGSYATVASGAASGALPLNVGSNTIEVRVTAEDTTTTKTYTVAVVRAGADGVLDPTFGMGGKTTTDVNGPYDGASALALQPDGKIVVAGWAYNSSTNYDFALARYTASGTLDPTFGSGGKVTTGFSVANDLAYALALQPDGKIVVAGYATNSSGYPDFALVRYTASGALDPTFGVGGKTTTDFNGNYDYDYATALALQPDGKIMVAGYAANSSGGYDFALVRYTASGALDPTFGNGGKVTTDFFGSHDVANALALQPDGKIVAAGYTSDSGSPSDFALARYTASGALDPTFGFGGKITTDFSGSSDFANAL